jgi:hypothetical protein
MNNLDFLLFYNTEHPKKRLGSSNDGGYVIGENLQYDILISCGIATDITFEDIFTSTYNINCLAFDGTIDKLPHDNNSKIKFIKKNIGTDENDKVTNLKNVLIDYNNIFLKMDIESYEFKWLEILTDAELQKFSQIVIEFHFPFSTYSSNGINWLDEDICIDRKITCLKRLADSHYLIHLHGNNCCGSRLFNGIIIPNVFECTYIRKNLCHELSRNQKSIPDSDLDSVNVKGKPDIFLSGYPYTI